MRDTQKERQRHRQGEKQTPYREPDVGLSLGTPGSYPEWKADTTAEPLRHPSPYLLRKKKSLDIEF